MTQRTAYRKDWGEEGQEVEWELGGWGTKGG